MSVPLTKRQALKEITAYNRALKAGFPIDTLHGSRNQVSAARAVADSLGIDRKTLMERIGKPGRAGRWKRLFGLEPDWTLNKKDREFGDFLMEHHSAKPSFTEGHVLELESNKDNVFVFGAAGDLHAASKYCRWDVREDLYKQFIEAGAVCNFDTGNWIDGDCRFNKHDIEVAGLDRQCKILADRHPKNLPTYAVWGDDHEGWYAAREGIDVGKYCERIMRENGHDWRDLGYMEAHVRLINKNSGKWAPLSVSHPGGGSAYAVSYAIQKIVESLEGGEKPAVALYGHYHKLWHGIIRNVFCIQTGTQKDQDPFMRKQRIEAHVGGTLLRLRQDPRTGAIVSLNCEIIRYFNREYYGNRSRRWSKHESVEMLERSQAAIR